MLKTWANSRIYGPAKGERGMKGLGRKGDRCVYEPNTSGALMCICNCRSTCRNAAEGNPPRKARQPIKKSLPIWSEGSKKSNSKIVALEPSKRSVHAKTP